MTRRFMLLFTMALFGLAASSSAADAPAIAGPDDSKMLLVPAGPFVMGTGEGLPDETPPHRVDLPAFHIDACEVTCAQYAAYLKATGATPPNDWKTPDAPQKRENTPVTNITWFDAMRYALWAGKRLPTEAEWEKAARGSDGRRFPWGNADDPTKRNLETTRTLEPVGSRPAGASPCGALDMSGNAYEWTADWYNAYPATTHNSVQFGRKYKVFRGGGAEYYYALRNPGTTTARARALTYGSHDFIGFRCAKDVNPAQSPYDPKKAIEEAQSLLNAALKPPSRLSYENEYDGYLKADRIPLKITGHGPAARAGIAFPQGLLRQTQSLQVLGPDGKPRLTQAKTLAQWPDASLKWILLDFPASPAETCTLVFNAAPNASGSGGGVKIKHDADQIELDTGLVTLTLTKDALLKQAKLADGTTFLGRLRVRLTTPDGELDTLPAETMRIEDAGPVRAAVHLQGRLANANTPSAFLYDLRVAATASSTRFDVQLTITHKAKRTAAVTVRDANVKFALADPAAEVVLGTDRGPVMGRVGRGVAARQLDDLKYEITGANLDPGARLPGWIAASAKTGYVTLGVANFWQNSPAALVAGPQSLALRTFAGPEPLEWEGGLAKTHDMTLDFSKEKPLDFPLGQLHAAMPPAWACGTSALGAPMLPRGKEAIERFPYWELFRETSMREWVRGMPAGFRDFGDAYLGGPYKGKNAYTNLEYDVAYNFLIEFLRTADPWYLNAVTPMARHQADIDTDHFTGQPWKHSPQHTTTEAELGHVFFRGLVLYHLLTGDMRSLDAAREVGDWIAATLEKDQGTGNERQIGWSLYALTGLYDATRDPKYLHACETLCNRLLAGQAPTGQFTNIRWDNRISFFNGIAMNGMLTVYEHNRNEKLADGVMKVAHRTIGMYPEYACRTLNAFIWAARRTNDPRFLDVIERTWELSTEYLPEAVTTETHAWHFRQFAAKHDLFPLFDTPPAIPLDPATWRGLRIEKPEVEILLQPQSDRPAPIMLIREGHAQGHAELLDASGKLIQTLDLNDAARAFQAAAFALPTNRSIHRLRLNSPKARAWQIHYDAASRLTAYDPVGSPIPDLYPRAYALAEDDATEIAIKLEAMGEGLHMATLYDPQGRPAKLVRHFIDFQDPARFELELKLQSQTPLAPGPWSIEVYKCKILSVKGLLPYWAPDPTQLFHPERQGLVSNQR